jgi:hypothetical protein
MLIIKKKVEMFDALADTFRHCHCLIFSGVVEQDGEFFTAVPACQIFFTQRSI